MVYPDFGVRLISHSCISRVRGGVSCGVIINSCRVRGGISGGGISHSYRVRGGVIIRSNCLKYEVE